MKKSLFKKTNLGNFVFINEENKSKEIQSKNVLSFTKFVPVGFLAWEVFVQGFFVGGLCLGGFVLIPDIHLRFACIKHFCLRIIQIS